MDNRSLFLSVESPRNFVLQPNEYPRHGQAGLSFGVGFVLAWQICAVPSNCHHRQTDDPGYGVAATAKAQPVNAHASLSS
jgi:hypothetical protein